MLNATTNHPDTEYQNYQLLDEEGYLVDAYEWTAEFTESKAAEVHLELTAQHWQLIEVIRDKYLRLGALPPMRTVCKSVGLDKAILKQEFGSCLNLWKIAGLPNPGEEAKAYMN